MKEHNQIQSSDSAYLEKLEFDPSLEKTWLNFFVKNFRVVVLLIILLSAWGIYAFVKLPRESNPEVKIPMAVVTATYPGASPADVEELVTKKIETEISGVKGIKKVTSNSMNSFSTVTVEFEANENVDDSIRRLRDKLQAIRNDIPADAKDPQVMEISFDDTPIVTYALTGPYDGFTLREYAEKIQDELEKIPGVREVNISGGDEHELEVAYDPKKLALYGITVEQANQAIAATNRAIPAGTFEGSEYNYPVRTDARFFDAKNLAIIPVFHSADNSIVLLRDIADVRETAIKKTVYSRLSVNGEQPQNSITISVIKRTGGSIINIADEANKKINELISQFPSGMTYDSSVDMAKIIRKDFDQLGHDFTLTLLLVVGILFLIVGLKEAFVAGLAIPLVFFTTFGVMLGTGTSLNFLSIFSLLLSLGLLVDDAIVVVSATKQYMKSGKFTPEQAVLLVLNDFKVVLTSTTLATIWAFLPLLMASGIMGEFIKSIPITVSVTLAASLLIALMINHPLAAVLERIRLTRTFFFINLLLLLGIGLFSLYQHNLFGTIAAAIAFGIIVLMLKWYYSKGKAVLIENKILSEREWNDETLIKEKLKLQGERHNASFASKLIHGIIHFDRIIPWYERSLRKVLGTKKRRIATILATVVLFVGAIMLPITGVVKSEFFPNSDSEILFVSMEAPVGLSLDEMNAITEKVEQKLLNHSQIVNFATVVGSPGSGGNISFGADTSNTANITIKLTDMESREEKAFEIAEVIRKDMADIQDATVTVSAPKGGPPSGAAFEAQISGSDLTELDKVANDLKPILASIPGTINISTSLKEAPAEYTFVLDPAKMELYNLNATSVGTALRTAVSGVTVTSVIRENKSIDVVAKFSPESIPTLQSIQNLQILNLKKEPVFVKDVAKVELKPSVESIARINQKRVVLLKSDVNGSIPSNEVVKIFQEKIAKDYTLPEGYTITFGGENEQNTESVMSILRAMIIAAVLIVSTLIIQFNSFRKAMIVLVSLPLALIGVFIGMAIFQLNLSFPGLIGILALFGIVVKNAIILIDKINLNIKFGIPFEEAIIDAGKSRLEAIFITSLCTIAGIIPITLSNDLWTALGSAIIFGLSISSFFTLFIVPTLYMTFIKKNERL